MTAKRGASRRSLKSDLKRVDAHVIKAREYAELPEATPEFLARTTVKKGGEARIEEPAATDHHSAADGRHCPVAIHGAWLADTNG